MRYEQIITTAAAGKNGCEISFMPSAPVVAMAYVPMQQFKDTYDPEQALDNGTLFPELNKPFYGRRGEPR